jgi:hypothetical protein
MKVSYQETTSPKGGTDVMVLQDSSVIVKEGCFRARHDMEVIGCARMFIIMDNGCHQGGKYLQVCQPVLAIKQKYIFIHISKSE